MGQNFIPSSVPSTFAPSPTPAPQAVSSGLSDLFELSTGMANTTGGYIAPKAVSSHIFRIHLNNIIAHIQSVTDALLAINYKATK